MPDNPYYPPDNAGETGQPEPNQPDKSKPDESQSDESNTALLPNSIFGNAEKQVGDVCEFKIVHQYEDETEVEYVKEEKSPVESAPKNAADEIDTMAAQNQPEE